MARDNDKQNECGGHDLCLSREPSRGQRDNSRIEKRDAAATFMYVDTDGLQTSRHAGSSLSSLSCCAWLAGWPGLAWAELGWAGKGQTKGGTLPCTFATELSHVCNFETERTDG